jgi:hypothetical protein
MEAAPSAAFEMPEPDLLLELLIVALDAGVVEEASASCIRDRSNPRGEPKFEGQTTPRRGNGGAEALQVHRRGRQEGLDPHVL